MIVSMTRLFQKFSFLCVCTLAVLFLAQQVSNAAPSRKPSPEKENDFDRPGKPHLIDNPGDGSYIGAGHGPSFYYYYDIIPLGSPSPYGSWNDNSQEHAFASTTSNGKANSIGTDSYAKILGVWYKDSRDREKADSTSVHFKYKVVVGDLEAHWFRPFYDVTAHPSCTVKLTVLPSDGQDVPEIKMSATGGEKSIITIGLGSISIAIGPTSGDAYYNNHYPSSKFYNVDIQNGGSHTAEHLYKHIITVSSYGKVKMKDQTPIAKAWGSIAWDFYMATNQQVPYKFPPPKTGKSIIEFYD